jgi:hypothetical protein
VSGPNVTDPVRSNIIQPSSFQLYIPPSTDLWFKLPCLTTPTQLTLLCTPLFILTCESNPIQLYDQLEASLVWLYLNNRQVDARKWVKAGSEYADRKMKRSVVIAGTGIDAD